MVFQDTFRKHSSSIDQYVVFVILKLVQAYGGKNTYLFLWFMH